MQYRPLLQKILHIIGCWASKLLSYAGRIQLIKSVLNGIQVYWSQIFLLPKKVIQLIQTACRTFLWTGKSAVSRRALVAWDKISLPKAAGGMGLVNLSMWNKAAICKHYWNLAQKKDKIWIKWVHEYYIRDNDVQTMSIPVQSSWIIKKILGARKYFGSIRDGQDWLRIPTFSIKNVYSALMGEMQQVPWRRMLYNNPAPPKCIFISWLLLHGSLATCEYMQRIGVSVDHTCCFCESDIESLDHLFFGCNITGGIWTQVIEWSGIGRQQQEWNRERVYLLSQCTTNNGKQSLYRCVFTSVVYLVWKERNRRRMQGEKDRLEVIVHKCKSLVTWCGHRNERIGRLLAL